VARMKSEGRARDGENGIEVLDVSGEWIPASQTDMSHVTDAVEYWNETGRESGPRSPEVRNWMLNPDNYELESSSSNRSRGASLGTTYLPPVEKPKDSNCC